MMRFSEQIGSQTALIGDVRTRTNACLTTLNGAVATINESNTCAQSIQTTINSLASSLQATDQDLFARLAAVDNRLSSLDTMSNSQSKALDSVLNLLKQAVQAAAQSSVKEQSTPSDATSAEEMMTGDGDGRAVQEAINRLYAHSHETEKTLYSDEAVSIIEDLEKILSMLMNHDESLININGKRPLHDDVATKAEQRLREAKRVQGLFTSSRQIDVNLHGNSTLIPTKPLKKDYARSYIYHAYKINSGSTVFQLRKGILLIKPQYLDSERIATPIEVLYGTIIYLPEQPYTMAVSISWLQEIYTGSFLSKAPALCHHRILPQNSEIFDVIESDNLYRFNEMLQSREVTIHDVDRDGCCLLSVGSCTPFYVQLSDD